MKTCTAFLAITLGLASLTACSSSDTTSTSSTGETSSVTTGAGGSGGSGGSGGAGVSSSTGVGGAGGATTSSATASSTASGSSSSTGCMVAFALTSTGVTEGAAIPPQYACAGNNGSPDLTWTQGPAGTLSYAVVLTDKSNSLLHWVIWDIAGATTSLPAGVEKTANPAIPAGSKQGKSYDKKTFGYLGPCPPNMHIYEFAVFALDVAALPNVTTASTLTQVKAEILNHDLATTTLTGTYTP
ncbi:MAG: YbhB/YbcL family Raf kinase inhibitor-like protein [Byssovorax sp.]